MSRGLSIAVAWLLAGCWAAHDTGPGGGDDPAGPSSVGGGGSGAPDAGRDAPGPGGREGVGDGDGDGDGDVDDPMCPERIVTGPPANDCGDPARIAIEGPTELGPWSAIEFDAGVASYSFAFAHYLRVRFHGTALREGTPRPVILQLASIPSIGEWDTPEEYVGRQPVTALLGEADCAQEFEAVVDLAVADLRGPAPGVGATIEGSLEVPAGPDPMHLEFHLSGCHTVNHSGP